MANAYVQVTKISNAVGRANYISDLERQEEVVLLVDNMTYSWEQHSAFETENQKSDVANNEAREIIIALPNNLYHTDMLKPFCDELVKELIPPNHDNEYAVHWNGTRTNLHIHILFSERANQLEAEPKVYKRDMWYDKESNKMAKANADGAELRYKKGEIQKDKDGNIKYNTDIFLPKDTIFKTKKYTVKTSFEKTQQVFKKFGFDIDIQTFDSPYLSQKKLYKGASDDYIEKASEWNKQVKKYNSNAKKHIELEPDQYENYAVIKKELQSDVKEANAEEKKISIKAIDLVTDMANWASDIVLNLKNYIKRKAKELEVMERWEQSKEKFAELFAEKDKNIQTTNLIKQEIENLEVLDNSYRIVINSKKELIAEMENAENQAKNKFFAIDNTIVWVQYDADTEMYFKYIITPEELKRYSVTSTNYEEIFNKLEKNAECYILENVTKGYQETKELFESKAERCSGLNEQTMRDVQQMSQEIIRSQRRKNSYEWEL